MNLVLTGFMGVGKSVTGKILSKELRKDFFDTDALIEKKIGLSINMIFEKFGEKEFRRTESEVIRALSQEDSSVISCGGGAVLNPSNVKLLGNKGIIINLYASPEAIYDRIKSGSIRPLLKRENPLDEIKRLLELRKEAYSDCDYAFNTDGLTPRQVVNNILSVIDKLLIGFSKARN
ncbi:MAG: shikimate kinase [Endomicrobium sp.]|jgi:shikimate kinase|nr:shikimate kinase [Endomicrobium sp.]